MSSYIYIYITRSLFRNRNSLKKIKFRITYFDRSWKVAAATNRLNLNMGSTSTEYEPLLLGQLNPTTRIPDLSSGVVEEFLEHKPVPVRWYPKLVAWESRLLWLLSGASIIVSIFNYMLIFATLTFTGHLGALELAGASIASVGIQGLAYGIMVVFLIPFISGILSPIKSLFLSSGFFFCSWEWQVLFKLSVVKLMEQNNMQQWE